VKLVARNEVTWQKVTKQKSNNMKIIQILVIGILLYGCTKIEAPYATVKNSNIKDTIFDWTPYPAVKHVLLEDYTGHKCVNCPEASVIAKSMEEEYHGKLIVLGVHAGVFAIPSSTGDFTANYMTTAGEAWSKDFGVVSNPNGLINRKDFDGSKVVGKDLWDGVVEQIIHEQPKAQMLINSTYNAGTKILDIKVFTHFLDQMAGSYKISVCIVQDSIVSPQKNNNPAVGPTPIWYDYVFNDVLRATVNGTYGEILTEDVNTTSTYMGTFSYTLNQDWVAEKCWVLAFVYNESTKEIVQAEKSHIIP
jgi:hypothetical protein